ncbi:MAG: hypothetical protein B6241_05010 [Spirochaetaceae bacterium 4572_59]|nr:MAG: hypothetical protein B6241_05010 [Spirochaetaceae bacterium 4572_59]
MKYLARFIWGVAFFLFWQGLYSLQLFHPLILPSPLEVFEKIISDMASGELPISLYYSLYMIIAALVPAVLTAFLMAVAGRRWNKIDQFWEALSALAHPLPGIALLPLLILWTGLGTHIIVLIVFHSVLWPFYINLRSGFRGVSSLWLDLGRNNELQGWENFVYILLPGAYPSLLAGLKISWARAWRAVISAEMIFGTIGNAGGLGWYIFDKRTFMDTPGMYSGILILMLIGILVDDLIFRKLESRMNLRWGRIS